MPSAEYERYIESPEWERMKRDAFARYGEVCMGCGSSARISVHHVYYPADLWETSTDDLMVLCWPCHHSTHHAPALVATTTVRGRRAAKRYEIINFLRDIRRKANASTDEADRWMAKVKPLLNARRNAISQRMSLERQLRKKHADLSHMLRQRLISGNGSPRFVRHLERQVDDAKRKIDQLEQHLLAVRAI